MHKVYKVYINDDPGLTLTYFMARTDLSNAYCRSRRQVRIYMTIGPLVVFRVSFHFFVVSSGSVIYCFFPKISLSIWATCESRNNPLNSVAKSS